MTWLYRLTDNHQCQTPHIGRGINAGDIWQCDAQGHDLLMCNRVYLVRSSPDGDLYWDEISQDHAENLIADRRARSERFTKRS